LSRVTLFFLFAVSKQTFTAPQNFGFPGRATSNNFGKKNPLPEKKKKNAKTFWECYIWLSLYYTVLGREIICFAVQKNKKINDTSVQKKVYSSCGKKKGPVVTDFLGNFKKFFFSKIGDKTAYFQK